MIRITPFFILLFILTVSPAMAAVDSFEVLDGPTMEETVDTLPLVTSPLSTSLTAPEETAEGNIMYDPIATKPPCGSSTCISPQMIANANHAYVNDSVVKSYITLLNPLDKGETCALPTGTGIKVHRQVYDNKTPQLRIYNDAFCLSQGCVYYGLEGAKRCE